jgi:hypothetical protein
VTDVELGRFFVRATEKLRNSAAFLGPVGVTRYALFLRYGSVFAFGSQADTVVRQASNIGSLFSDAYRKPDSLTSSLMPLYSVAVVSGRLPQGAKIL